MKLWQLRNKHTQERSCIQDEVGWIIFCVEACQEIPEGWGNAHIPKVSIGYKRTFGKAEWKTFSGLKKYRKLSILYQISAKKYVVLQDIPQCLASYYNVRSCVGSRFFQALQI